MFCQGAWVREDGVEAMCDVSAQGNRHNSGMRKRLSDVLTFSRDYRCPKMEMSRCRDVETKTATEHVEHAEHS